MGVYQPPSDLPPEAFGPLHVYEEGRRKILTDAEDLRRRAEKLGLLDEVARIFSPPKNPQGGQRGAKKAKATKDRQKLFQAYRTLKAAQPDASDITIAEQLIRKRQTYGKTKNADSVKRLIDDIKQKMKDEKRSLLDMAGPRKKGRRKKER